MDMNLKPDKQQLNKKHIERQAKIQQNNDRKKRDRIISIVLIIIVAAAFVVCIGPHLYFNSQAVIVNGKQVAVINGTSITQQQFNDLLAAKLKERAGNNIQINETVELKKIHTAKRNISINTDVVIADVCNQLTYKGEGAVIKINGEEAIVLASKAEAENVLNQVLDSYKPEGSTVIEVSFLDEITVDSKYVDEEEISTPETAYKLLTATTRENTTYTVQAGDAFSSIAQKNNMTEDELLALNPDITKENMTRLQIGQVLNVVADIPVYPVKTVLAETTTEAVTMSANVHTDDSRYKTYRLVLDEGVAGECVKTHYVSYINGYEKYRKCVDTKITKEPQNKRVIVGTQDEPTYNANGSFIYPIQSACYISSGFGPRDYGNNKHFGTDFAAVTGTDIYASDSGIVVASGESGNGYGIWVVVDHQNGFKTLYAHCSETEVQRGERVKKGQVIAKVGNTGDSTGSHLHFEIMQNEIKYDPMDYLA